MCIGETGCSTKISLNEPKYSFKIGELKSKILVYAVKTERWSDFAHLKVLISNINDEKF